jgi:hypothetical protein
MHVDAFGVSIHCPVVSLVDRRTPRPKSKEWLLTKAVETILFGPSQVLPRRFFGGGTTGDWWLLTCPCSLCAQRTTGALFELLKRNSFEDAVLVCEKKAVTDGILTEEEFGTVKTSFKPLVVDVEARNRVKRCSLVPVSVVVAACAAHGRCAQTVALMRALQQLPRVWELQIEQERLRERHEADLLLNDELAEAEQEEPMHLASELSVMVPFVTDKGDEEKHSWRLSSIPAALTAELDAFTKYRQEALNIHRHGGAVVPITVENDRATCLRFLGWLSIERQIAPGLGVFGQVETSQWVSDWIKALQGKGLKYSSLASACRARLPRARLPSTHPPHRRLPSRQITPTASSPSPRLSTIRSRSATRSMRCPPPRSRKWCVCAVNASRRRSSRSSSRASIQTSWNGRRRRPRASRRRRSTAPRRGRRRRSCCATGPSCRCIPSCHVRSAPLSVLPLSDARPPSPLRQPIVWASFASCASTSRSSAQATGSCWIAPRSAATRRRDCPHRPREARFPPPALRISLTGPCPCGSYGPSVTTLSPLLNEVIGLYLAQLTFDAVEDDTPYLFHPQRDTRRCVVSSQWSAMVSSTFKKHAGKAVSPKSLRSSFARAEAIEPSLPSTESV